jgi:hypothetical protein
LVVIKLAESACGQFTYSSLEAMAWPAIGSIY